MKKKLMLVTTVPETLESILNGQPAHLAQSFEIMLVSSQYEQLAGVAKQENVPYHFVPMKRGISPLYDCYSILRMMLAILKFRPEIIHSYTPKAGLIAACAGFLLCVPHRLHTFTGLIFPTASGFKRKLLITIDRLVCRLCTKVIPEGQGVRNDLINHNICKRPNAVLGFGNIAGIDFSYFNPELDEVISSSDQINKYFKLDDFFVFCFVGRLNKDKGIAELIAAFLKLNSIKPVKLLILGAVDGEAPIDNRDYCIIQSHPDIVFFGHQKDIRSYLLASDVHVLPSYREGFPNVVLQAGAMGRSSLVTNINGSNEIISNGHSGMIVEARNEVQLFEAMQAMSEMDTTKLLSLGQAAKKNVLEKYDRIRYLNVLENFYMNLSK